MGDDGLPKNGGMELNLGRGVLSYFIKFEMTCEMEGVNTFLGVDILSQEWGRGGGDGRPKNGGEMDDQNNWGRCAAEGRSILHPLRVFLAPSLTPLDSTLQIVDNNNDGTNNNDDKHDDEDQNIQNKENSQERGSNFCMIIYLGNTFRIIKIMIMIMMRILKMVNRYMPSELSLNES